MCVLFHILHIGKRVPVKHISIILSIMLFATLQALAQANHVSNPGGEQRTSCPTAFDQVNRAVDWDKYTSGTSDYFNACAGNGQTAGVPTNSAGYQQPHGGNAYFGAFLHGPSNYREYLTGELSTALTPNTIYRVSMYVSLSSNFAKATDNLGVYFFKSGPTSVSTFTNLNVTPQIDYGSKYGPLTDTLNWMSVTAVFTADSAYEYFVIGGFRPDNNVTTTQVGQGTYGYYFIDDVSVVEDNSADVILTDTLFCAGDTFQVGCDAAQRYTTNNVFTVYLSDPNGDFSASTPLGSRTADTSTTITCIIPDTMSNSANYRIRILSTSFADTSDTVQIRIANIDSSNISVTSNSPVCESATISLSASTNVSSTTFSWSGPSFTSSQGSPVIGNAGSQHMGVYTCTLSFYGCKASDTVSVFVKPLPAVPSVNNNGPICEWDTLKLYASSNTQGVTYSWSGPGGFTSATQNPVLPVAPVSRTGVYMATATLDGCSRADTTAALVKQAPDTVTLSSNPPLCNGDTLKLNSTSAGTGVNYSWTGPLNFSSSDRNTERISATLSMSGWYKLVSELNNCTYTDSIQVTVNQIPGPPNITHPNALCAGETLTFNTTSVTGATYNWTGPNNYNSTQQNPVITNLSLNDTGTYTVTATKNSCTSAPGTTTISINPTPFVVAFSAKESICAGDNVTFTALPNNFGGTPTYQWYLNTVAVGTGPTYTASNITSNDVVMVEMTEYTKCSQPHTDPSNDVQVAVLPWRAPSAIIVSDKTGPVKPYEYITFTAQTTNAGNPPLYQWKRNGNDILGAVNGSWSANTLQDGDVITVEIRSRYRCPQPITATSNAITVQILTTVGSVDVSKNIRLHPNPNNGRFIVSGEVLQNNGVVSVEIMNALGQHIYQKQVQIQNNKLHHKVVLNTIAPGYYLLRLKDEAGNTSVYKLKVE